MEVLLVRGVRERDLVTEATPRFDVRATEPLLDSKIFNRVKELRGSLTSRFKGSGNFAYADTNISGLGKTEFYAHSSTHTRTF